MQLETKDSAENYLGMQSSQIGIKISATTFKLIFSSIYERKEEAVLRELAANALDAHIAAQKADTPISITLPTDLNPFLIVKDEGTGMSLETVEKVFFNLFESTKNMSNDEIGGFGIGSKAPYAISDSYTISTVKDGKRTEIIMTMNEGVPEPVIVAAEVPTDQENSTTVSVPVNKEHERREMRNVAARIFKYWDTLPVIHGIQNLMTVPKTSFFGTKHYSISYNHSWRPEPISAFDEVLVGPFVYKIPGNLKSRIGEYLERESKQSSWFFIRHVVRDTRIILNTEIGKLELAPSRERIEDTDDNYEILRDLISGVIKQGIAEYEQKAVEMVEYIYSEIPKPLTKYGIPAAKQEEITKKLITIAGADSLVTSLLNLDLLKKIETPKNFQDTLAKLLLEFDKVEMGNKVFTALNAYTNPIHVKGASLILRDFETKKLNVGDTSVRRYGAFLDFADAPISSTSFVLVDAHLLTNAEKAKINYNFRTNKGTIEVEINKVKRTISVNDYFELHCKDKKEIQHIADNYALPNSAIIFTYDDIKDQLDDVVKTKQTTSTGVVKTKVANKVICNDPRIFNDSTATITSVTTEDLYNSNKLDDYEIVVYPKAYGVDTYMIFNVLPKFYKKKLIILELSGREVGTKRFEEFKEKATNLTVFDSSNTTKDIYHFALGKDLAKVAEIHELTSSLRIGKDYIPDTYKDILAKYDLDDIRNIHSYSLYSTTVNNTISLYNVGTLDEYVYKTLERNYPSSYEFKLCELAHSDVIKRLVKKSLDRKIITLK